MYIVQEGKLKEAFGAGKAKSLIDKIGNVLSRRIGKEITFASFPVTYTNSYGHFQGFYGSIGGSSKFIRLNFLISNSDAISSLDIYTGNSGIPAVTIELLGFNIVQIVEIISEELSGKLDIYESKVVERTLADRKQQLFDMWLKESKDALDLLQNKKLADVYSLFLRASEYNEEVNFPSFVELAKAYLFGRGLTNPTFRKRKKGSAEREIVDQAKQDQLADLVDAMGWEKKFQFLKSSVKALAMNKIQGVIIYGSPGSGKSETVYETLKEEGVAYKKFSGGFKNADEVFKILTKYRNDTIIVFDDADSVWKNVELANIFKAALQNSTVREITWRDTVIDFTSGVIFISNLTSFNSAIMSRSMSIEINLSNKQMIDKIEKTLTKFHPEVDMKVKTKALDFLKEWQGGVKTVDYRELEKVMIAIEIEPYDWENFAKLMMASQ